MLHSGEWFLNWLVLETAWLAERLWGICLGPWNPVTPPCVTPPPHHNSSAGASWQVRDSCMADLSGTENGTLCKNVFTKFPGNCLPSLSCISPPTKISRDQSVSLWGSDHWWFIWGSLAKWSQCLTGFHQSISSAFPLSWFLYFSVLDAK